MDSKSDEVDGKPESEVGVREILQSDTIVMKIPSEVESVDSVTSSTAIGKNHCSDHSGERDQISAEINQQAEASVCDVESSSGPELASDNAETVSMETANHQTSVSSEDNIVPGNTESVSMETANHQTSVSNDGNTVPGNTESVSMETDNQQTSVNNEGNTVPGNTESVSMETANQKTSVNNEGNTVLGNGETVSMETANHNTAPGNTEIVSIETVNHQTSVSNESKMSATEHAVTDSTAVQKPCFDESCDAEGAVPSKKINTETIDSTDNKQSTDISMETEDSVVDSSSDFSQIQITCVQSIATYSPQMEFGDSIQTSSEGKEALHLVPSEVSEITAMEVISVRGVTSSVEQTTKESDISTTQINVSSSDVNQIADSEDQTSSNHSVTSTVVKSDFQISSDISQTSTEQTDVASHERSPLTVTNEVKNISTEANASYVSSEKITSSTVCTLSKPEEKNRIKTIENSEKSSGQEKVSELTVTFSVNSATHQPVITSSKKVSSGVDKVINNLLPISPKVLAVQSNANESQDMKKSSVSQKFSTYTLNKARTMLHSALGTMPVVVNPVSQLQQLNPNLSTVADNSGLSVKVTKQSSNVDKAEEHGDILDILKTHQKEAVPEKKSQETSTINKNSGKGKTPEKGSNQIAKKSTTKKPAVTIKDTNLETSVKQEPVDGYNGYGYSTPAKETSGNQVSTPSIVIENVQGNPTSPAVNHNSLSSQVKCVPPVASSQKSLQPGPVAPINRNPTILSKLVPSDSVRAIVPTLKSTTISDLTKNNRFVPVMAGLGPATGPNRVTIRLSNSIAAPVNPIPVPNMPRPYRAPRPIQPKALEIHQPMVNTTAVTNKISTPALAQTPSNIKTSIPQPMSVSTINIDTVGLPRITELIARKNPIPNYKAPIVPENLKGMIKDNRYLCYECGDLFWIESSLLQHRGRYSMKIIYKCDECNKQKCFFNKCQFLGHLRQHLNIDKSQAVPIHIKSDSISIAPLPKVYESLVFQTPGEPWTNSEEKNQRTVKEAPSRKRCHECGVQMSVEEMSFHYNTASTKCDFRNICGTCNMVLPSICSLRAHRCLHGDHRYTKLDTSICPECGEQFFKKVITYKEKTLDSRSAFIQHLRYQCCHISRIAQMQCPQIKNHILAKLDQYYKCQVCPMAFRTAAGFERHFVTHQKGHPSEKDYKRIYKCHVCDTVLDDIAVLELHIAGHVKEFKQLCTYGFVCIECRQVFSSKEHLSKHIKETHAQIANKTMCLKCNKSFGNVYECFLHDLMMHRSSLVPEYRPCKICGDVMELEAYLAHPCIKKKTKEKYVCNFCDKEIVKKKHLTQHMEWHKSNGAAVCLKCFRTDFSDMDKLKDHEVMCLGTEQGQVKSGELCIDCKLRFKNKEVLEKHRALHHPNLFPCHLCGATYQNKDDLKNHVTVKHVAKRHVYPCQICNGRGIKRVFSSNALLEKHLTCRHRQGKNHVITQKFLKQEEEESSGEPDQDKEDEASKRKTDEVANTDQPFKKLRVEGETRFTCAKCSLTCEDRSTFLKHLENHKVENFIQCMECGLSFAVLPSLRKHLFMVHKVKDFNTYCQDNGIEEAMDVDYDKEIRDIPPVPEMEVSQDSDSVEEEDITRNPLECRVCHRVFDSETDLRTHTRTHGMAFIRNKRRNKMVPSATTKPPQMNGVDTEEEDSSLSFD
ncbi:LOW QUALITY PROTEIN: zinc finger protein 532-like [Pecten maximus]|uniref:LOW QUALITY PROTEIN: zinc finger protein 532-like n=1 Tax=Pecten maximus TaxID=6579 RepID=UPI001458F155|nr:LOW QUALITY PROTEIN: zinc finger protein 532-like [Pecten maximus]